MYDVRMMCPRHTETCICDQNPGSLRSQSSLIRTHRLEDETELFGPRAAPGRFWVWIRVWVWATGPDLCMRYARLLYDARVMNV